MTEIRLRELLSGLDTGDIILSWLSDEINKDMEAFAEWCYINAEWCKENEWMLFANDGSGFKVTNTQMRERWEVETGRKEATE